MLSIFRLGLIAIIVSGGLIPAVAGGDETSHDEKAIELLREFSKTLTDAKTIKTSLTLSSYLEANGRVQKDSGTCSFASRRPNKLAWVLRRGNGFTVKSDGDKLFFLIPRDNKYTEQPAPETLSQIYDNSMSLDGIVEGGMAEAILSDDPFATLMEGVDKVDYQGIEEVEGVRCHKIKLSQEDVDRYVYLQAQGKLLPVFVKYDLGRLAAKNLAGNLEASEIKAELTVKFGKWELDTDIPDETFKFKPPTDAKKVDAFGRSSDGEHPMVGKAAPDFELDLLDGGKVKLSDHKGKDIVILDFWATWCGPCRRALPVLINVAGEYADRGVVFYAVNLRESPELIKAFMKGNELEMTVALDQSGRVGGLYGVTGIPQTVVIGKKGKIEAIHSGFGGGTKAQLERELDAIIAGNAPAGE